MLTDVELCFAQDFKNIFIYKYQKGANKLQFFEAVRRTLRMKE